MLVFLKVRSRTIYLLTSDLADVDIKGELLVLEVEHLVVLVLVIHEVDARANVAANLQLQAQLVTRGLDAVGAWVVGTIESTVSSASHTIRAKSAVPSVAGVAVGRAAGRVGPAPVAVKHNALGLGDTSAGSTGGHRERRVVLWSQCTGLLRIDGRAQGERREGEVSGRHVGDVLEVLIVCVAGWEKVGCLMG